MITIVRWLVIVLILRVLFTILANYPDYFPPDFDSLFLQGREQTFPGTYRLAFYVHIVSGPIILVNGLILLSDAVRRRYRRLHRMLGRAQAMLVLACLVPTSMIMCQYAFGGWPAGLSFFVLSAVTAGCTLAGVMHARRRQFHQHRRWMIRSYVLLCSAVVLRLLSGGAEMIGITSHEPAYVVVAWASWLLPLAGLELANRLKFDETKAQVPGKQFVGG